MAQLFVDPLILFPDDDDTEHDDGTPFKVLPN